MESEYLKEIDGRMMVDVSDAFAAIVVRRTDQTPPCPHGETPIELEAWASGITREELAHVFRAAADHWSSRAALDDVQADAEPAPAPPEPEDAVSAPSSP